MNADDSLKNWQVEEGGKGADRYMMTGSTTEPPKQLQLQEDAAAGSQWQPIGRGCARPELGRLCACEQLDEVQRAHTVDGPLKADKGVVNFDSDHWLAGPIDQGLTSVDLR